MAPRTPAKRVVRGDDLLYRFFRDALDGDPELFAGVPQLLITTMGIWLPLDAYERWPVLLPWVVRDPKCRRDPDAGGADMWSSPDADGYLRDDNSMIKSLPRALVVRGPKGSHVRGARMGTEFVACHVWRVVGDERLASRIPLLNSFVPNLVWLPRQVAKLSDIEGGIVQRTLQAMAYQTYRHAPVAAHLHGVAEEAWAMIPEPSLQPLPFALHDLNWFETTEGFYRTRSQRLASVIGALEAIESGQPLPDKIITTRYAAGLRGLDAGARAKLRTQLLRIASEPHSDSENEDERLRVEYMSTGNLIAASVKADGGDPAAAAWLADRHEWLRTHDLDGPQVVVVDGEVLEIEADGQRTYVLPRERQERRHDGLT